VDRVVWAVRTYHQHVGQRTGQDDGRKRLHRVISDVRVDADVDGVGADRPPNHRIAVRLRAGDRGGTQAATGAGAIFNDHRLAEHFAQVLTVDAPDHVGCAAG